MNIDYNNGREVFQALELNLFSPLCSSTSLGREARFDCSLVLICLSFLKSLVPRLLGTYY